ncbi:rRNA maturation RNase YbeY [Myxococcota bacterium]|nr:rRNA maturation RNase YbeY [Myxococcota bacterium]
MELSWAGLPEDAALAQAVVADAEALLAAVELSDAELSFVLCSDPHIQGLNQAWRGKDAPTDVLSFPQEDEALLGDLVISVPTATRQAQERGTPLQTELRVLMVHGLLHLLGYDHETNDEDLAEMADAERRLLSRLGWSGQGLIAAVTGA